jgi:MFS family permease
MLIALAPSFWPVLAAQVLIGGFSSIFLPAIAAISLGVVGHRLFDRQQGRNQTFNAAGNVVAAVSMGIVGYFSNRAIFFLVALLALPTLASLARIRPDEIDHDLARNAGEGDTAREPAKLRDLWKDKPLVVFLLCAVLFHFSNAAMLPLLGEMLAKGKGRTSMLFMSACVVTTQIVITFIASLAGRLATRWGRKPLLLIGFAVLPLRGVLYTCTHAVPLLVAIQILDGIGAGIFGVLSILVIADMTRGTGRFNLTQGAIATAVGIGASLSQVIAGGIVHHAGYSAGFLFLAAVAGVALAILWWFMPETRAAHAGAG